MILLLVVISLLCACSKQLFDKISSTYHKVALLLAGCSDASHVVNMYLASVLNDGVPSSISDTQVNANLTATFAALVNKASPEIRAGYFALCVRVAQGGWDCRRDPTELDPLNLMWATMKFKDDIVSDGLMGVACPVPYFRLRIAWS